MEHPLRLVAIVVVLVVACAGAFLVGRLVEAPSRDRIEAAQEPIIVTAEVESRVVDSRLSVAGSVVAGQSIQVVPADTSPPIVVRQTLNVGDPLGYGALVGVVAGQPYFAMPAPLPLYRNLVRGDRGDDVLALQGAMSAAGLVVEPTGVFDRATIAAIRELYKRNGFELPDALPYQQLVPVPSGSGRVTAVASVGTSVDEANPLLTIQISAPRVTFRADTVMASELAVGDEMTIRSAGGELSGQISDIGDFHDGSDGTTPGREVTIVSEDPALAELDVGSPVTVQVAGDEQEAGLAVPITALYEDEQGTFVRRLEDPAGADFERVGVRVARSGGGWAALTDTDGLAVGDLVRVS